jgi:hypothetical protein
MFIEGNSMAGPAVPTYKRHVLAQLEQRLREPRRYLQVLAGPRQSGKTTLAHQVMQVLPYPSHYATADEPATKSASWMETQWEIARTLARRGGRRGSALLVLDEAQKAIGWSETVKKLWDEDTRARMPLRVLLLGSAPLLVQSGLTESLAGRFEVLRVAHWSFPEMREAFGWNLERYLLYGGYPGSASLVAQPERWTRYILDSLIETTIARDILLLTRIDKPVLLRQLFQLACQYSGEILSYTKMLGQLHDAGNTTTLAHYLRLLYGAGMVAGLSRFSGSGVRRRASSPKLIVLNTALMTAMASGGPLSVSEDPVLRGRLVETAVGAHLLNDTVGTAIEVFYWREGAKEVDFIVRSGRRAIAIEVKSGRPREARSGIDAFGKIHRPQKSLIVGSGGLPLEDFLSRPVVEWFG